MRILLYLSLAVNAIGATGGYCDNLAGRINSGIRATEKVTFVMKEGTVFKNEKR